MIPILASAAQRGPAPSGPQQSGKPHRRSFDIQRRSSPRPPEITRGRPLRIRTTDFSEDQVRIIPLGGLEEVGRNMTLIEYKNKVLVIDVGLQFPEEDMPGIDYIIPNISYLTENKQKEILGVIITHGHMDHIGAIPHIVPNLGNPTIYATALSRGIILKRQDDYPHVQKLDIQEITKDSVLDLKPFRVEFFHVNHNIPGSVGVVVHTPMGVIMHTGDFKFDFTPVGDEPADLGRLVFFGMRGVDVLMSDSTNSEVPGHTISEVQVQKNLEEIIKQAPGRIVAATFGSLVTRVQQLVFIAEKYDRKVALDGYSMKSIFEISRELGFMKAKKETVIPIKSINEYPPNKVMLICTGAQGEGEAVLMRIANKEHRSFIIQKGDSIIFSSSVVPGNERTVQALKDILMYQGARIFHSRLLDIHASGHAQAEDLKLLIHMVKPKYLIPIHGNHFMLRTHADIAESIGMKPENVAVVNNGRVLTLTKEGLSQSKERVPTDYVMVDGLGVGDVGSVVLRDRQTMAKDGMLVVIAVIDGKNGKVIGNPDIISRGFIYLRESKTLLSEVRKKTKEIVERSTAPERDANWTYVKNVLRDQLGEFLFRQTKRRPMVLPVVIEV